MCGGGEINPNHGGSVGRYAPDFMEPGQFAKQSPQGRALIGPQDDEKFPVIPVRDLRQLRKDAVPRPGQVE